MSDSSPISIVIITKDRPVLLQRCLVSIQQQSFLPLELIIIEDTSDSDSDDLQHISSWCRDKRIVLKHRSVSYKNYAKSRNSGLGLAKGDLIFFVDDDVILDTGALSRATKFFSQHPLATVMSGPLLPIEKNIWSEYDSCYINDSHRFLKRVSEVDFVPTAAMVIRRNFIVRHSILFNNKLITGEDHDFINQISRNGGKVFYDPNFKCHHHFRKTFWSYWLRHLEYSRGIWQLQSTQQAKEEYINRWLPHKRSETLLTPIMLVSRLIKSGQQELQRLRLPSRYSLPALVDQLTVCIEIFLTTRGRKLFWLQCVKLWTA